MFAYVSLLSYGIASASRVLGTTRHITDIAVAITVGVHQHLLVIVKRPACSPEGDVGGNEFAIVISATGRVSVIVYLQTGIKYLAGVGNSASPSNAMIREAVIGREWLTPSTILDRPDFVADEARTHPLIPQITTEHVAHDHHPVRAIPAVD